MKTIAIIDDDLHIGNVIQAVLQKEGYNVIRAYSGTEALYLLSENTPDLVLLDLMMPGLSGEEVLPHISGIPVIIMSAKVDTDDKVNMLMAGASDYITKPFDIRELLARITARLRAPSQNPTAQSYELGRLKLNSLSHDVTYGGNHIKLTKTEYAILKFLIQNPEQAVSKSVILDRISIDTPDCTESSLKIHVSNLRKKLRDASGKEYIESVWGIGFKITDR